MTIRNKTGGRLKGTPNKSTNTVRELLSSLGCDPIEGMAKIAIDENVDIRIRAQMYRDLAPYVYPRLSATDLSVQKVEAPRSTPTTKQELLEAIKRDPFIGCDEELEKAFGFPTRTQTS